MSEDSNLEKIRRWCERTAHPNCKLGVGDDAAVIELKNNSVFCSDFSIEGVHFSFEYSTPSDVAWKAIARSLSDVAAMGARPAAVTISLALPKAMRASQIDSFLENFYEGAVEIALAAETTLAGGDLTRIDGPLVIDIAALGEITRPEGAWRRSQAKAGDLIFVSGTLGGAAFALDRFRAAKAADLLASETLKHRRPIPRLDIAKDHRLKISAAMDISDGLVRDLYRMCSASRLTAEIRLDRIPLARAKSEEATRFALYGGDDYELLLALSPNFALSDLGQSLIATHGLSEIGVFRDPIDLPEVKLETDRDTIRVAGSDISEPGHDPFRDGD